MYIIKSIIRRLLCSLHMIYEHYISKFGIYVENVFTRIICDHCFLIVFVFVFNDKKKQKSYMTIAYKPMSNKWNRNGVCKNPNEINMMAYRTRLIAPKLSKYHAKHSVFHEST